MANKQDKQIETRRKPPEPRSRSGGNRRAIGNRPTRYEDPDINHRKLKGDLREQGADEGTGYGSYGELPKKTD